MDNYKNKTKPELIAEIERLEKHNNSLKVKNSGRLHGNNPDKEVLSLLKEGNEKYAKLFDSVGDGIFIYNPDTFEIIEANSATSDIYGYSHGELIGMSCIKFSAELEKSKSVAKAIKNKDKINVNVRHHKKKDGTDVYVELSTFNIPVDGKNIVCGVCHDITAIKNKEEELLKAKEKAEESETKYNIIAEHTYDWETYYDNHANIIFINSAFEKITGYSRHDFQIKKIQFKDFVHKDDLPEVESTFNDIFIGKTIDSYSFRIIHKNGKIIFVEICSHSVLNSNNELIGIRTSIRDISARKKAEQEILFAKEKAEESEKKLKTALASMTEAVFISDTEGNFIDFNEAFATFHKFKNKSECGKSLNEFPAILDVFYLDGEFVPLEMWVVSKALRGETGLNKEYVLKRKDTSESWIGSYNYSPLRNNEGNIIGSVVTARDITEIKNQDVALRESEKKYRDLINQAQEGIWVIDKNNITSFANPSMAKMLGYSAEEMIGKSLFYFMDEKGAKVANDNIESRKAGIEEQHDFEFICKNGDRIFCTINTAPIIDEFGDYQGSIAGVLDISERNRALEELKKHHDHLDELVKERTAEIEEKNKKLDDQMKVFVGRELRIKKLEQEIKMMGGKLPFGH